MHTQAVIDFRDTLHVSLGPEYGHQIPGNVLQFYLTLLFILRINVPYSVVQICL